ncbi:hypothetical protein OHC33_001811 [Knufia fluminis]|uniref:Cytochrome P450 n=1 Tax=Knufia fluminis TaxID=191047 RepID=A0AAN8I6Y2_9EURO|nr:hypothetical protein OHC33_001811 [Knufia fluminis]
MVLTNPDTATLGPIVWTSLALLLCSYAVSWLLRRSGKPLDLPQVDCRRMTGNKETLQECFEKYAKKDEIFKIRLSHHDIVMLPPKLINEVKNLPEDKVSFSREIYERFNGRWTGVGKISEGFVQTIGRDLTRHTGRVISDMVSEFGDYIMPVELGNSKDWVAFAALPKCLRIVALITGRSFIGLPSSRDERWVQLIISHTRQAFGAGVELWRYPSWIRNIIAPFTKCIRDVRANQKLTEDIVRPRVEERVELLQNLKSGKAKPDDPLQWLMNNTPEKATDIAFQAKQQLGLSLASIHTTGNLLTQCFLDLAAYSEYQQILRKEILEVLEEQGSNNITKQTITKLRKLDSFVREVQRFAPSSLVSVNRLITAPEGITLTNGFHLPHGAFIATPAGQVAMDRDLWEHPTKFDGLRFDKLRSIPGNENKYQFVTTNTEHILFGYGTHACPGRFFASNEIKIVLMYMVLNYDLRLEGGQDRPPNRHMGIQVAPDPTAKVEARKRANDAMLVATKET